MTAILVIEDDRLLREEIAHWLMLEEFRVYAAACGEEGLALARKVVPDLIITDIMMPGLDGYAVLTELRADAATASVPIIFLTARAERPAIRLGMGMGADDYITKPFTLQELLTAIRSRLQQRAVVEASAHKEMDELRNQLVRTLPHELMTPLSGIIGLAELLGEEAETLPPSRIHEMASFILSSAYRLQHLIENYLSYAELELVARYRTVLGKLPQAVTHDAGEVIAYASHQVAGYLGRGEDLDLALAAAPVAMEARDLEKVVEEFLDNAFKFSTPGDAVQVEGSVEDQWFVLSISDHGCGMTPEQIRRIGAYVQFDRAIHEQQGAGLGAIVARRLVELYGGRIEIESSPGVGTTVHMRLPLPGSEAAQPIVG
jgi:two-component system, sensor histidine kinase and response regulator